MGNCVNLHFIDWIWHVRGSLALAPGQSSDDAFDSLDSFFRQTGTSHQRSDGTLTFTKKDQAAQDKMSVFDSGVLRIEKGEAGSVLRYDLISRALLYCFLAPLLFLAIAQFTTVIVKYDKPPPHEAPKKQLQMNPVDKFLGAPAPDLNKKDDEGSGGKGKKLTPTSGYVFAGIFAALYLVGRILEDRLIYFRFRQALPGSGAVRAVTKDRRRRTATTVRA